MGIVSLKQDDSVLQTAAPHCTLATLAVYHEHMCVRQAILCYTKVSLILGILVF